MLDENYNHMLTKMTNHFKDWSYRSLSILGKVQIIKTFGISQFLYALAVLEFLPDQWKSINKLINKFIWNKNFNARNAPHRIKKDILYKQNHKGGFGMVYLSHIATSLKLKRFSALLDVQKHPIAELQIKLGAGEHFRRYPRCDIDDVTTVALENIYQNHLEAYRDLPMNLLAVDLIAQHKLLETKIINVTKPNYVNSRSYQLLRRSGASVIRDTIERPELIHPLLEICENHIKNAVQFLWHWYIDEIIPNNDPINRQYLFDLANCKWMYITDASSRLLRLTLFPESLLVHTKLMDLSEDEAISLYTKINKITSIPNRTKILRLIHGDVYCGSRTLRFGLSDSDRCIRCFDQETISHLLLHCPYTREVWQSLGYRHNDPSDLLNTNLSNSELEILAEFISAIVFRKQQIPPAVLILNTFNRFANGLSKNNKVTKFAKERLDFYTYSGNWFS